jgi:GNAT superfamily N-acetyltransferase
VVAHYLGQLVSHLHIDKYIPQIKLSYLLYEDINKSVIVSLQQKPNRDNMTNNFIIRPAQAADRDFIFTLSPGLAEVAELPWHTDAVVQKMQDDYIVEVIDKPVGPQISLIAEKNNIALGFIHACSHKDSISGETCGTVPLLAILPKSQGIGVGRALMQAAESWAKEQGYRLLHLEVFAHNNKAQGFYQNLGFEAETLHMIKEI